MLVDNVDLRERYGDTEMYEHINSYNGHLGLYLNWYKRGRMLALNVVLTEHVQQTIGWGCLLLAIKHCLSYIESPMILIPCMQIFFKILEIKSNYNDSYT